MQEQVVPFAAPRVRAAGRPCSPGSPTRECAVLERRHGSSPPRPAAVPLSHSDLTTRTRRAWKR
eukprot:scaffold8226_cov59-Phaeocystis_antarctica.AAC.2